MCLVCGRSADVNLGPTKCDSLCNHFNIYARDVFMGDGSRGAVPLDFYTWYRYSR